MVGINSTVMFSVVGVMLYGAHMVNVQRDFLISVFGGSEVTGAHDGRYNMLLLGGDSGADRWGMRPDSINVASIDAKTGQTIIFGLPRNMTNFPFPEGSVHARSSSRTGTTTSSTAWPPSRRTTARCSRASDDPGVAATIEGVEGITGLEINYFAMVNLEGFRSFVNAMGGAHPQRARGGSRSGGSARSTATSSPACAS